MKEIRKIINAYDAIDFKNEKAALASVVNVEESSYRRIGARMLVCSNGLWTGGISGGCLEGDALKRSQKAIFNNTPSKVVYDTMDDDSNQIGVGLGCNGRIEVVLTPIDPNDLNNEIEILRKSTKNESPSIILKIIESNSKPEWLGLSIFVDENAQLDFCDIPESNLSAYIEESKEKEKSRIFNCRTNTDIQLKLLIEFIRPEKNLFIIGDNYDVSALVDIANVLGWHPYVIGKAKKLGKEVFDKAYKVYDYDQIDKLAINRHSAVILMTHDYKKDSAFLPLLLSRKPGYLGMLGPKKRMIKMEKELSDVSLSSISHFYSPVGLEIGAESPEEIALSIASEIVAVFRNKSGGSLKFKKGTIHEREL